jgi:hypothetical protein
VDSRQTETENNSRPALLRNGHFERSERKIRFVDPAVTSVNKLTFKCVLFVAAVSLALSTPASATVSERNVLYSHDLMGRQLSAKFDSAGGADGTTNTYNGFGEQLTSTIGMAGFSKTLT